MKKSALLLMSLMLVSLTGCQFFRSVAGRPTDKDIEEKRIAIIRAEEQALQNRLDSIRYAEAQAVSDSIAEKDSVVLTGPQIIDALKASGVVVGTEQRLGGLSGTVLEYRYYIIVGAFRERANARNLFNVASAKGYDPVLLSSRRGLIAVALAPTNDAAVLKEMYDRLRTETFCPKEAWILVNE